MKRRLALAAIGSVSWMTAASVWDGVYSSAQATRGEKAYRENCASCHGVNLEGSGQMPPLSGSDFTTNWNGMTLGDLFDDAGRRLARAVAAGECPEQPDQVDDVVAHRALVHARLELLLSAGTR